MLRTLMQKIEFGSTYISRSSFQWILHQALVADDRYIYCGLIGADTDSISVIEKVAMIKDVEDIEQTLSVWQDLGIQCLGFFHFENETVHEALFQAMSLEYKVLKVRLAEKGRLDILANQCNKQTGSVIKLDLGLIEDGQETTVV
ncbi:MAG: hypothetical protein R8M14_00230 [Ghiorsea sp.]